MRWLHCAACGLQIYFENSLCSACGAALGFVPERQAMATLQGDSGTLPIDAGSWVPCANRRPNEVCNWLVHVNDGSPFCLSCRLTSTIPPLDDAANLGRWAAIERAKRRLVFTTLSLGLSLRPKLGSDDRDGLEFRWLAPAAGAPVVTGHHDGVITLDITEADDDHREAARVSLGESSRTVLGHLRHELGHHLHQRFVAGTPIEDEVRAHFGDERQDYDAALRTHYEQGPPPGWEQQHISAYASAHPWEDWAETCAHYLLMIDAVETAQAWGLAFNDSAAEPLQAEPFIGPPDAITELVLNRWLPAARLLNAMSRSLGQRDSYPFLIAAPVLDKLRCVRRVLLGAAASAVAKAQCAVGTASSCAPLPCNAPPSNSQVDTASGGIALSAL